MEFEEVLKKRKSIKKFKDKQVPNNLLNKIIELANLSPSAGNIQARSVIIVRDKNVIKNISQACLYHQEWMIETPTLLVVCANIEESEKEYGERGRELYAVQDATIFTSYLQLAATNYELSTRWVGAFDEEKIRKIFDIKDDKRPVAMITIGYPDAEPKDKPRKSLKEIIIKEI